MATKFTNVASSARLTAGQELRIVLEPQIPFLPGSSAGTAGPLYLNAARSVWEKISATGLAFPITPFSATAGDAAIVFDVRVVQAIGGGVTAADLVNRIDGLSLLVQVREIQGLQKGQATAAGAAADREDLATEVDRQRDDANPVTRIFGEISSLIRFTIVVIVLVVAVWAFMKLRKGS
jgi:hypothetical protein